MNINQKINQNFKDIVLTCISANRIAPHIKANEFFKGYKNPQICKTNWITISKKMKVQNNIVGVGKYLKSEPFI